MRVLLLYPPITHQAVYSRDFRRVKGAETSAYPPLGLMCLQAMVKRETVHNVRMLDLTLPGAKDFDIASYVRDYRPDIVGLTAYTLCFYDVISLCRRIKAVSAAIKIVLGGPHVSLYPLETMEHPEVDFCVTGDGERPFLELLQAVEQEADYARVPSLTYRDASGTVVQTPLAPVDKDLDGLPEPCRDDLSPEGYFNPFFAEKKFATIATSRGCPFSCTFCDVTDKIFRARSVENILAEMRRLGQEEGITSFFIVDDLFNITTKRVEEFCDAVMSEGLKIKWIFRGRIDQITPGMLDKCKRAGCVHIIFGVEDFTDEGLRLIKKKITVARAKEVFAAVRRLGIKTTANFIIGFPHHRSREQVLGLSGFLNQLKPDYLQLGILIPFPGSAIFAQGAAMGVVDPGRWTDYVKNPVPVFEMPLWEEHLSLQELTDCYERILKRFYFSPWRLAARLAEIRSLHQLLLYIKVGLATWRAGRNRSRPVLHPEELVPTTPARDHFFSKMGLYKRTRGRTLVDIGAGTGFFASRFAGEGTIVRTVDVSWGNARLASQLSDGRMACLNADSHALPFKDSSVDAVFCSCVVEHFEDPELFFAEVHRILKPSGEFLLTVDIRPKLSFWLYRLTFLFDHLYDSSHPMLHKKTSISDSRSPEFIDPAKMTTVLAKRFEIQSQAPFCGLNFNLVHCTLVIVNKLYQMAMGRVLEGDDYSKQTVLLGRPLFRLYIKLLPFIRFLANPGILTFDAIYHFTLARKKRP